MGIKYLSKLIATEVPDAVKKVEMANYFGKVIAIDASIILYQFLTSARDHAVALSNQSGEDTSHLSGVLYRTLKMLENGIKPIFVFDGKPPKEKEEELKRREENREKTKEAIEKAKTEGNAELVDTLSRRTVKITENHTASCKKLLDILGVPCLEANGEAEAQCAMLVKNKYAYAVATEDMDALTFGSTNLIRRFSFPVDKNKQMEEYNLDTILNGMNLTIDQFVDLCILLGCDYCDTIKGVGPTTALKLITKNKSIENILKDLSDNKKYTVPARFDFESARNLFLNPGDSLKDNSDFKFEWKKPDEEKLYKYLVEENNFDETRIKNCIERIKKLKKNSGQSTIDSFFGTAVKRPQPPKSQPNTKNKENKPTKKAKK